MTDPDTYNSIREPVTGYVRDRGSRFIGYACPVASEDEIKSWLAQIKKKHHDAHHHCYAWALGPTRSTYRINDDGEPSGSAGKPIYGQILSKNVSDILVVVVRYFGGTKLGIPGLIRAYRGAAVEALAGAEIIQKTITIPCEIHCPYSILSEVMHIIREENLIQQSSDFGDSCSITMNIRQSQAERILERFNRLKGVEINHLPAD